MKTTENESTPTFHSLFFPDDEAKTLKIPDYQRAFSWKEKQIEHFITDLEDYSKRDATYYFGHFITQENDGYWSIVDGQQRITIFVLFLLVCRNLTQNSNNNLAFSLIEKFSPVSYDSATFEIIINKLSELFMTFSQLDEKKSPSDQELFAAIRLHSDQDAFTSSQRRMMIALLKFRQAFRKGRLETGSIDKYITTVMQANCSLHLTKDPSVAVNIFEMHNTRGMPLTTLEVIKALLMKFVYDNSKTHSEGELNVEKIQTQFGEIYGMEEMLAVESFRGEMTMEQLLTLHLRVIDDGEKVNNEFNKPDLNAGTDKLTSYIQTKLHYHDLNKKRPKGSAEGLIYALNLAQEFKKSVTIVSKTLPTWDQADSLVGDVLILEKEISTQFFLLVCRSEPLKTDLNSVYLSKSTLADWEKLLFTRDLHNAYHGKTYRDDFPGFFAQIDSDKNLISGKIQELLKDGFRSGDTTKDLQKIVSEFLHENQPSILNNAYHWWKHKMIYAIYKFETNQQASLRKVMKGTISVEHILPQEWNWEWTKDEIGDQRELSDTVRADYLNTVGRCINGLGNLLLLTTGENSSAGNKHPSDKTYTRYFTAETKQAFENEMQKWRNSKDWPQLIENRGDKIYKFMMTSLVGIPQNLAKEESSQT